MPESEYIYKVVLAGDPRVGKTSVRLRYLGKGFEGSYLHTIGADFAKKTVSKPGFTVQFQIWDLSGQHSFHSVRVRYYDNASAIIFMFSVVDSNSFFNIYNWLTEYFKNTENKKTPIFLMVGNKIDLSNERKVSLQDIKLQTASFKREFNIDFIYFETSALSGQNVDLVFDTIIEKIMKD